MSRAAKIQTAIVLTVAILLTGFFGAGWYYAGEIQAGALQVESEPDPFDLRVQSIIDGKITLETTAETSSTGRWDKAGTWGLASSDTYNQVGKIVELRDDVVVRDLVPLGPLPRVGDAVRVESSTYPGDPQTAHGIAFQEIQIPAALGHFPAWFTSGGSDVWVILVHGKGADRREFLRILPTLVEDGYPTLTITYRNDRGLPASPSGYYQFGADEWEDLDAAAAFALASGAQDLVLVGNSMGGAIVVSFLYNSPLADRVTGVILDSPALNLDALIDYGASQRRVAGMPLPGALTGLAKFLATLRFGIDFQSVDYLKRTQELAAPILLFHGGADTRVPISVSDRLAEARPNIVEYATFDSAAHTGSWNIDRERYEDLVRRFLARLD